MGPFDPATPRSTSVVVLKRRVASSREELRILASLSAANDTKCLGVELGRLVSSPGPVFPDEATALSSLSRQGFVEVLRGNALLGFASTDQGTGVASVGVVVAGVLVATSVTRLRLPGGHAVQVVTDAQWVTASSNWMAEEPEFFRTLKQFTVGGTHYYCETVDLTRPFPSAYPVEDADLEFVWNHFLTKPFRAMGLGACCPKLLQGAVECSEHIDASGARYAIAKLSRRSRRHPGTRYLARGLNKYAGPGNEIEVELILWKAAVGDAAGNGSSKADPKTAIRWCRHFWRRGTVPIWWGVEIQPLNKGLQAEVYVADERTYVGSTTYFLALLRRVAEERGLELTEFLSREEAKNAVTCINLLHCNPKKASELMLSSHFQEGARHVKDRLTQLRQNRGGDSFAERSLHASGTRSTSSTSSSSVLRLMNFDWHGTMASLTEEKGVEAFWHFIEEPIKAVDFAAGSMIAADEEHLRDDDGGADVTRWGGRWKMAWDKRQAGILRYNCADSLDRTNAASCFAVLPVLQQTLAYLGVELDMVRETSSRRTLPPGWELRNHGGRPLYIDHNTKKTQWSHPSGPEPSGPVADWKFFSYSLKDVKTSLNPIVIHEHVAIFRKHGDVHSELYTGSPAMHSHILGIVKGDDQRTYGSASSSVGKLQNLKVAVQRRWNNTVSDAARQQAIECFVGLDMVDRHDADDPVYYARPSDTSVGHLEDLESTAMTHLGSELEGLDLSRRDGRLSTTCVHDELGDDSHESAGNLLDLL